MNKQQVKGAAKDAAGKIQREAGRLTGSKKQQAQGLKKQVTGKATRRVGDFKQAIRTSSRTKAR